MNNALLHHFKRFRRHQMETYSMKGDFVNGRNTREFSGGGAAVGHHAMAAFWQAKRHIHFMQTLKADLKKSKKRSDAAKKGWKSRKAA